MIKSKHFIHSYNIGGNVGVSGGTLLRVSQIRMQDKF